MNVNTCLFRSLPAYLDFSACLRMLHEPRRGLVFCSYLLSLETSKRYEEILV